jgi:hypothetical protein
MAAPNQALVPTRADFYGVPVARAAERGVEAVEKSPSHRI